MPIIKRYANRKYYDTTKRRYITLTRIAEMIRGGQTCHVIDNQTGDDITTRTLIQIILDQEKEDKNFLPRSIFEVLIYCGHYSMRVVCDHLPSPIEKLGQVKEDIRLRVKDLITKGSIEESTGKQLLELVDQYLRDFNIHTLINDQICSNSLHKLGIPSRQDILELSEQIDVLNKKIALLMEEQSA